MTFLYNLWECIKILIGAVLGTAFVFSIAALMFIFVAFLCGSFDPEKMTERRKQKEYDSVPHIYSQVDGCTVYRWMDDGSGRWHYFTKCANKVTTESHYDERVGKITKDVKETIVTER